MLKFSPLYSHLNLIWEHRSCLDHLQTVDNISKSYAELFDDMATCILSQINKVFDLDHFLPFDFHDIYVHVVEIRLVRGPPGVHFCSLDWLGCRHRDGFAFVRGDAL